MASFPAITRCLIDQKRLISRRPGEAWSSRRQSPGVWRALRLDFGKSRLSLPTLFARPIVQHARSGAALAEAPGFPDVLHRCVHAPSTEASSRLAGTRAKPVK